VKAVLCAGTSGWAYAQWKPEFYPSKLPASKFLEFYSGKLNSVEVNFTFRQRLQETTAESWLRMTPPDFKFSLKAHQAITHFRRLKDVDELLDRFLHSAIKFHQAKKLGVLLFQIPSNMKCDLQLFADFLKLLPGIFRYVIEFRHPSWLNDDVYQLLRSHNIALCVTEGDEELSTPDIQTADFSYFRFRRPEYPRERIEELATHFSSSPLAANYAYFKHEETAAGAHFAVELLKAVADRQAQRAA
jgi:uncharacterized protein YecE (DUF72 family)